MESLEQSEPSFRPPDDAALYTSRYKILNLFQKVLRHVHGRLSRTSLDKAQSLAEDLGITSGQLDRKLRHCSGLRVEVIRLLQDVLDDASETTVPTLQRGATGHIHNDTIEMRLDSTLHSLVILLSTMKDPPPSDDIQRLTQAVREDVFTQFDVRRVQDKFPKCDSKLHRRIGALNRLRRLRLQDSQRSFECRMAIAGERKLEAQNAAEGIPGSSLQLSQLDVPRDPLSALLAEIEYPESDSDTSSIASSSNTSGYRSWAFDNDLTDDVGTMEPRHAVANDYPLSMPRVPRNVNEPSSYGLNCPFCMLTLKNGISQAEWEEHVLDDVEPFMCTFGGCPQSYRIYSSRDDWKLHENTVHRIRALWICHECDEILNSAESFKNHLRSTHQKLFAEQYLDTITRMCKDVRPNDIPRPQCILCGSKMTTKAEEFDHLALHLLDLALFVLPRTEHIEEDHPAITEDSDSHSENFEGPPPVEGLRWFHEFQKNDVVPFETLYRLGEGRHSRVDGRRCTIGPSAGTVYACKRFYTPSRSREKVKSQVEVEANILKRMKHVHVISITSAFIQERFVVLVLFPVFDTNLRDFLPSRNGHETLPKKWFGCLTSGLIHLHDTRIQHRDIKPHNIGIRDWSVILSGFSSSQDFGDGHSDSDGNIGPFTRRYAAPEVLERDSQNSSADIFSLGCVFLEMLVTFHKGSSSLDDVLKSQPHIYSENPETFQEFLSHLEGLPKDVQPVARICSLMLSRERKTRPTAKQVLQSLIEASERLNTLHVAGSSLVGRCVLGSMKDDAREDDAASVRTLTLR